MASMLDLLQEEEYPDTARIPVKCSDCVFFKSTPHISIDGIRYTCSSPQIGRRPNQVPCPEFTLDAYILAKASPDTLMQVLTLLDLLASESLDRSNTDSRPTKANQIERTKNLMLVLAQAYHAFKAGYTIGGTYLAELPSGIVFEGILATLAGNKKHAILVDPTNGQRITVATEKLVKSDKVFRPTPPTAG